MRPVLREGDQLSVVRRDQTADPVASLLDWTGPYCNVCERPLHERAFAWDGSTGELFSPFLETSRRALLLLCRTCAEIQQDKRDNPGELALAFDATLSLPQWFPGERGLRPSFTSPGFVYLGSTVVGLDEASARTITYFGLNGPRSDPRRQQRERVVNYAVAATETIAGDVSDLELRWIAHTMAVTGCLSTWLSILFGDFGALGGTRQLIDNARATVPGFFPGTDWGRITMLFEAE